VNTYAFDATSASPSASQPGTTRPRSDWFARSSLVPERARMSLLRGDRTYGESVLLKVAILRCLVLPEYRGDPHRQAKPSQAKPSISCGDTVQGLLATTHPIPIPSPIRINPLPAYIRFRIQGPSGPASRVRVSPPQLLFLCNGLDLAGWSIQPSRQVKSRTRAGNQLTLALALAFIQCVVLETNRRSTLCQIHPRSNRQGDRRPVDPDHPDRNTGAQKDKSHRGNSRSPRFCSLAS